MSDLRDSMGRLREDVTAVPMPPAEDVRRRADRRTRRLMVAAATVVVVTCGGVAVLALAGSGGGGPQPTGPASGRSPTAPAAFALDRPWLPGPWRVVSARVAPLPDGGPADPFCGLAALTDLPDLPTQTLVNKSAEVSVYGVTTPAFAEAGDLFKRLYDECGARTAVESREGPALYWSTPGPAGSVVRNAARWDGALLVMLSVRTVAAQPGGDAVDVPALVAELQVR